MLLILAAALAFALWNEHRTGAQTSALVVQALERAALIGRIRVNAVGLDAAVARHIRAESDESRQAAGDEIEVALEDIARAVADYTSGLPAGERAVWTRFVERSEALGEQVLSARTWSNRREAERARRALEERIRPLATELDELAAQLSQENADLTVELLGEVERLRRQSALFAVTGALVALLAAFGVALHLRYTVRRQEETIQAQLGELDRRNAELDAFASRVAHDLVSPLGPLRGYLTLIRRTKAGADADAREMLERVDGGLARAVGLVEALLRFCRAGRQELQPGELDTAVRTVLLELDQVAARDGVGLERSVEAGLWVSCPLQLLQSVAQNLVSNAVKYTAGRPDARVTVRVAQEAGGAVLEVSDNGIGISEEAQRSLFQPFFRAAEARALPGYGLGLCTARRIVEAHGGTLLVQSVSGEGTRVTVRLPRAPEGVAGVHVNGPGSAGGTGGVGGSARRAA